MDSLLQRLSEQSSSPLSHIDSSYPSSGHPHSSQAKEYEHSGHGSSNIATPATEEFPDTTNAVVLDAVEFHRLKNELQEARNEVVRMSQELHTTNQIKSTFDHAVGQSSEPDYGYKGSEVTEQTISQLQSRFNASTRPTPTFGREQTWPMRDEERSEKGDTKSFGQAIWNNDARQPQYQNGWGMNTQGFGLIQVSLPNAH
jgi:hypothetical protein